MSRITRTLAACSAALTVLAASAAVAQSADSTRSSPPPTRRGMMGPGGGMRDRMAPNDSASPRRGGMMHDRMGRGGRGGPFAPGAPGRGAMMRSRGGAGALMRGITLSTDQEKALRSSQSKHIMASKPLMLEMMSARTDEQLARLNGDQKGLDAATARVTASRTKLDSLRRQRSPTTDLRAVLTPDQQKILDKNLAERGPKERMGRMGPGRPGNDGARGFRSGGKSPRGPRNAPRMRRWTEDADSTKDGVR